MPFSVEAIWRTSTKKLLDLINTGTLASKTKTIRFYGPSFMYYKTSYYSSSLMHFPTISLTGTACTLNCKHCEGKVLQTMQPAESPKKLFTLAEKLKRLGAFGCLLSGGCLPDGSIPITRFIPTIEKIKRDLGLTVFIHTGIIRIDTAIALKDAGVDATLIDIVGSDETVKEIGNLKVTVKDYADSLKVLQQADLKFVPHVIVGLHNGKLKGELDALKLIASVNPSAIVIIAFMPIFGTAMAEIKPPQPTEIARVITMARIMLPRTPLALGCVRPKGKHRAETDILALKAGVDAIAFPHEEAIGYAKAQQYEFNFSPYCCAQIYMDAFRNSSK